jgi:predicted MFS family arabinose efflux permease
VPRFAPARVTAAAGSALAGLWRSWLDGLAVVRRSKPILAIFVIVSIALFGDSMTSAVIVPFVNRVLDGGSAQFGLLMTVRGLGGLAGGLVLARFARGIAPGRLLAEALLLTGVVIGIAVNLHDFSLVLVLVGAAGVTSVGWLISEQTLLQTLTPDAVRGRVFGAYGTTLGLVQLTASIVAGVLGDRVGIVPTLDVGSLLYVAAGVLAVGPLAALLLLPRLSGAKEFPASESAMS